MCSFELGGDDAGDASVLHDRHQGFCPFLPLRAQWDVASRGGLFGMADEDHDGVGNGRQRCGAKRDECDECDECDERDVVSTIHEYAQAVW